ncbi:amidohydrolase family protein [Paenibacillus sp. MMS18-CY102]|uniref:amidohydrolase family protein n=1 Tax=Paenibacillus sp. MMS18-CY102 TaxID=2682849 RepID=UPI0013667C6E|nr:amidohydrolase family protein [Paenibacillus sp. MMS18-CY102]MWC29105.1 amidohydrolase family protein [Paenibacillus sp. MMS18-CY102]
MERRSRRRRRFRGLTMFAAGLAAVFVVVMVWISWGGNGGNRSSDKHTGPISSNELHPKQVNSRTNTGPGPTEAINEAAEPNQSSGLSGVAAAEKQVSDQDLSRVYDIVIKGGRVINPETKLDAVMNVGIAGGQIGAVTAKPLKGKRVIQANGLVVAPGFIDNLSYDPNPLGVWNKIADGVTSNIAMHGGTSAPDKWYAYYERNETPVHFGASFFYSQARNQFKLSRYAGATDSEISKLKAQAEKALNNGALGISFSLEYVPGIEAPEIVPLMKLAHEYNVPVYFHARYSDMEQPGTNIDALKELIGYARETGAAVHIDHINSTGGTFSMKQSLDMVNAARAEGLDITACIYPYDYWGTYLNSARFDEGWQSRFRISYHDLQIAGTTHRLTEQTFAQYKKEGKLAVAYAIPPEDIDESIKPQYVMIGSDAILEPGLNNHPRASGTFARTIGLYAREKGVITLMEAVEKTSLLPAQRLEKQAPALKNKGRVAKGMDADLVLFDYNTIIDKSTVEHPDRYSGGIQYVLINGKLALDNGKLNKSVRAGEPIKSEFQRVKSQDGSTLLWDGEQYPAIYYNGQPYIDLNVVQLHGYSLKWNQNKHYFLMEKNGQVDINQNGRSETKQRPEVGALMLERDYQVAMGRFKTSLLSIEERNFFPIEWLGDIGFKLSNINKNWTIEPS